LEPITIETEEGKHHRFSISLDNTSAECLLEENQQFCSLVFMIFLPVKMVGGQFARVAEFVSIINCFSRTGCFIVDQDTGIIMYRSDGLNGSLATQDYDQLIINIEGAIRMMRRFYPGFMTLMYSRSAVKDIFMQCANIPLTHYN